MSAAPTVACLFSEVGLHPAGPFQWRTPVQEHSPGVYVIALVPNAKRSCAAVGVDYLPPEEQARWLQRQPVIYIGRTRRSLARRIGKFYRHRYGQRAPHRGGQAVHLLRCLLWVYWSPASDPRDAECIMLESFCEQVGARPFANRRGEIRQLSN